MVLVCACGVWRYRVGGRWFDGLTMSGGVDGVGYTGGVEYAGVATGARLQPPYQVRGDVAAFGGTLLCSQ